MQDTVSALTVYVTFGFVGIAILFWWRQTLARSGEPPLVPYLIPWVGSAISMGKDPDGFFQNAMCVHLWMACATGLMLHKRATGTHLQGQSSWGWTSVYNFAFGAAHESLFKLIYMLMENTFIR
jgi:hypothetical protein